MSLTMPVAPGTCPRHCADALRSMILASVGFGAAIGVCACAPFLGLAYAALLLVGWASVSFILAVGGVILARRYGRPRPPKAMTLERLVPAGALPAEAPVG